MASLFIHAGYFKTGTTAIQEFCHRNRDIMEENGYYYLQCGRPKNNKTTHSWYPLKRLHELGNSIPSWFDNEDNLSSDSDEILSKMSAEATGAKQHNIIMSSEEFVRFYEFKDPKEEIEKLCSKFIGFDVKVVFYLREPVKYAESWYNQMIKAKAPVKRFSDFWLNLNESQTHYCSVLNAWAECVGKDNVIVRPYCLTGAKHVCDFLDSIGLNLDLDEVERRLPKKDVNKRLTYGDLEVRRIRNHVFRNVPMEDFLYNSDKVDFSESKVSTMKIKADVINEEIRLLVERYGFFPASSWGIDIKEVFEVESRANNLIDNESDDKLFKSILYMSMRMDNSKRFLRNEPPRFDGNGKDAIKSLLREKMSAVFKKWS